MKVKVLLTRYEARLARRACVYAAAQYLAGQLPDWQRKEYKALNRAMTKIEGAMCETPPPKRP